MIAPVFVLTVLVLSPSSLLSWTHQSHFHSPPDTRITVRLHNPSWTFVDVAIDGHTYTLPSHHTLDVKGPAGVAIVAASRLPGHRSGDVLVVLAPSLDEASVELQ